MTCQTSVSTTKPRQIEDEPGAPLQFQTRIKTPGSYGTAFHPYHSVAKAVLDDALDGWGGNIEASREPWDLPNEPIFLTVTELRERCAPLTQALQAARAA